MSSIPFMKFYPGDYLGDTQHLTTTQHGAYLLLIFAYWQRRGPLPADDKKLSIIVRSSIDEWNAIKAEVLEFFEERDGALFHNRLDRDLAERVEKSEKAKRSVQARERKRSNDHRTMNERSSNDEQENNERSSNDDLFIFQSQKTEEPTKGALQSLASDNETSRPSASSPEGSRPGDVSDQPDLPRELAGAVTRLETAQRSRAGPGGEV